jgi:hypothetical protein
MTSKRRVRLLTDEETGYERVIEIRILDFRQRDGVKQRSLSLSVPPKTKNDEYETADELKEFLNKTLKGRKYV